MPQIKIFMMFIVMPLVMTGCKQNFSYTYLMEHPATLKEEVMRCESNNDSTCYVVMRAANDFTNLINEQQEDPEKFGQRIMTAETACVNAKNSVNEIKQSMQVLKSKQIAGAEWQAVQDKLEKAEKSYSEKKDEVKILLAVAGLNSPE